MRSISGLAVKLTERIAEARPKGMIIAVDGDHHAETLAWLLKQLTPDLPVIWFPAWDCLPYDRTGPSPEIAGRRMRALYDLHRFADAAVVLTTAEALVQRVPDPSSLAKPLRVRAGTKLDVAAFAAACSAFGYTHADRIDDPGEMAVRGEVIDIYPPVPRPFRIVLGGDIVTSIHAFDPVSQRTVAEVEALRIDPVTELPMEEGGEPMAARAHWLPEFRPVTSLLSGYGASPLVLSPEGKKRLTSLFDGVADAHRDRLVEGIGEEGRRPLPPDALYITAAEWRTITKGRLRPFPTLSGLAESPRFCLEDKPGQSFAADLEARCGQGRRVVLAGPRSKDRASLAKEAERALGVEPVNLASWAEATALPPGGVGLLAFAGDHGFDDARNGIGLITAADLIGHHALARRGRKAHVPWHFGDGEFATGDVVIHLDHGVGVLKGLEAVSVEGSPAQDVVRLGFAEETDLIIPVGELDRVWRYGASVDEVTLDRLDTPAWPKRQAKIARDIDRVATALLSSAAARQRGKAAKMVPPRREYERFVAGFRFAPTADQMHAIDDCLRDLASGRAMERLVIGDVGFGKTEVALRAAAAAVLAGYQVAVVAPTTVLVRQHAQGFAKRFAEIGIEVAQLSRLVSDSEAAAVREGLANGRIRLVVGTHALAAEAVTFSQLGLLIIDEEQRFGLADKEAVRSLGTGVHVLTITATPIPRTLQSAMVGLQDLSVMTTAPALRRPIRTHVEPYDAQTLRAALLREKARGGQSFVVVPRIEDLGPLQKTLAQRAPDLLVRTAHGRMEAQAVDETMTAFAAGDGDVLLATSIIESGLDVPRANTMLVCGAERFGLAQLHQLRGRVGRGRHQGICHLMTTLEGAAAQRAEHRLAVLTKLDRLGSGLAISAEDLDARGAGDLAGEDQAGHLNLIGLGLYQHLLQRAIRQLQGNAVQDWWPELNLGGGGGLDASYIPEADVRLNLYARLARVVDEQELGLLVEEVEDRFGPLPDSASALFTSTRLRCWCRLQGVARIDAGPKAVALTPRPDIAVEDLLARVGLSGKTGHRVKDGRVLMSANAPGSGSEAPTSACVTLLGLAA